MIFKVDFEKAYDSIRWDFVDTISKKFGFGDKWCKWIHSCLQSSRGSILINGSPTPEFQFFKGLKQGDPLSPFLFILVMESLHLSFQRVVDAGLFSGIKLDSSMSVSHLFYADNAIFMGQWNQSNIDTIVRVLKVFHSASGLRINMKKSKLMGIVVDASRVEQVIRQIGCMALKMPFKYLGSVVGDRIFFNGADNKVRKSSWVSWNQVMASKDAGGLGVASLFALNRGLLFKWVWRFITQQNSLWAKVITAIHGNIGKTVKPTFPSIWLNIIQEVAVMKLKGYASLSDKKTQVVVFRGSGSLVFLFGNPLMLAFLPCGNVKTRWVKEVPIKINILA
ncbi:RNA-directed DNA polymerase, eukaryota [Tanacetum coccineum]